MNTISNNQFENPLKDLVANEVFEILRKNALINETSLRDYLMRKKFKTLRKTKMSAGDAIDILREDYPYLQFDTIRKIVYNPPKQHMAV